MSRAATVCSLVLLAACAQVAPDVGRVPDEPALSLLEVTADTVLPGTRLALAGENFVAKAKGTLRARLLSASADVTLDVTVADASHGSVAIDADVFAQLGGDGARFDGQLTLRAEYRSGARAQEASRPLSLTLRQSLTPELREMNAGVLYLGSPIALVGDGFLTPDEGGTHATLRGTFTPDEGAPAAIDSTVLLEAASRQAAGLVVSPEVVGIRPGRFLGTLSLENRPLLAEPRSAGAARDVTFLLGPTAALELTPVGRRGQRLVLRGRGFIPKRQSGGQATILRLEGTFTERGTGSVSTWRGGTALELVPEYTSASLLSYLLHVYQTPTGDLTGLGLVAGTFEGRVTPVLLRGDATYDGLPLTTRLEIRPQRQVVYLKYLAGFTDTLRAFGLRNVELQLRERILQVGLRDYGRWNIEFREARPTDYEEYAVVEVGGVDPNGQGLFGLDNTTGKDLGNLRFNDVIGGFNAETEEQGYLAYGGVFLESFLSLSPRSADPLPIATPTFDELFDPFREDRGGRAVAGGEYPGSPRDAKIAEAVRVLGNLVGSTITHEIGHTLGLAIAQGYFHNPIPGPNQLMDSGDERPFEERAELGGQGPAELEPEHVLYLDEILPQE